MTDDRATYVNGLRALADLLDNTPDLPLPNERKMTWQCTEYAPGSAKAEMARIIRLIPGTFIKNDPNESLLDEKYCLLTGDVGGMPVEVWAERATVCRRVVTGTAEVTETVPSPDAPLVEVTRTVDTVEWVCEPLLALAATARSNR